jgi:2-amino-4-hydroxy-6-hydroxymethyldihydropteridine diphosphokinase
MESDELTSPHAGIAERRFVLEPLAELVPGLRHPVLKRTIAELLAATKQQSVRAFRRAERPGL